MGYTEKWEKCKDKNGNLAVRAIRKLRNGYTDSIVSVCGGDTNGDTEPIQNLIAAAPALLEACKRATADLRIMSNSQFMNQTLRTGAKSSLDKIQAAIAAAEGSK